MSVSWNDPKAQPQAGREPLVSSRQDRAFFVFNALVSGLALALIAYLLIVRRGSGDGARSLRFLPAVNAGFNGLSACLLTAGYVAIQRRAVQLHRFLMVSAFVSSALFFAGYLTYHAVHGDTRYAGGGPLRAVYLSILASHVLLSIALVPMAFTALYFALRRAFARHRRIARVLFPIWLYVSVTGVVIFLMLRGGAPATP